ncbi:MAG: hypothetical protein M1834_006730 [Cirrosporium novae-zelandiae]|nr:MAG: hypothetical protein M1834_006730 [Cirrosporium novae-zelandiae]
MGSHEALDIKVVPIPDEAGISRFCEIEDEAFGESSDLMALMWGLNKKVTPAEEKKAFEVKVKEQCRLWAEDPTTHFIHAVLPDGTVAGVGRWSFFPGKGEDQFGWPRNFGPNANKEMCDSFFGIIGDKRIEALKGKPYWLMALLAVLPQYQRKGVGKKLLAWGTDQADKNGHGCWIDATPQGKALYEQVGWEVYENIDTDLEVWGGEKYKGNISRICAMLRKPKGQKVATKV